MIALILLYQTKLLRSILELFSTYYIRAALDAFLRLVKGLLIRDWVQLLVAMALIGLSGLTVV